MPPSAATGTTDNPAPASAPSSSSASGAASSGTPGTSTPASGTGPSPSSGSSDSALAALERVAAASAEVASSAANTDNAPAGGGSPPASTEPATSAPAGSATRPSDVPAQHADNTPEHRITAAVRNARAELETELGWARSIGKREEVERYIALGRRLDAAPDIFAQQLMSELKQGQEPEEPELVDPQPLLRSEDGRLAYTDEQARQIAQNAAERVRRELRKEFGPALQYSQTATQREEEHQIRTQATEDAQAVWNTMLKLPHFKERQKDIDEVYRSINTTNPEVRQKYGSVAVLQMAYNKVLAEKVLPTLGATAERQTIADLQRSAHAGNQGIATTAPVPVKPAVREGNVDDLARDLERRYAEAAAAH